MRTRGWQAGSGASAKEATIDELPGTRVPVTAALLFVVAGVALAVMTVWFSWHRPAGGGAAAFAPVDALEVVAFGVFVVLGALLVLRRPGHPMGWLLAALGLSVLTAQAAQAYALRGLASPAPWWGAATAAWISYWAGAVTLTVFIEVLLLFPTGRPPSPRWRWLVLVVAVGGVALTAVWAAASWALRTAGRVVAAVPEQGAWAAVSSLLGVAMAACLLAAAGSLVLRFRRATGVERLQLKWLALAAAGLLVAVPASYVAGQFGVRWWLLDALGIVSVAGVAVAVALAVLRYRLYEIDRIISRTLSYGLLSALLAGVYAVAVVVIGGVLESFSAGSNLTVAASTLAVAGSFAPLRRRVQAVVDRRFNRARYDADLTLAQFQVRLRDEVRLETVAGDLVDTVRRSVQPERISVWLPAVLGARTVPSAVAGGDGATAQLQRTEVVSHEHDAG